MTNMQVAIWLWRESRADFSRIRPTRRLMFGTARLTGPAATGISALLKVALDNLANEIGCGWRGFIGHGYSSNEIARILHFTQPSP